MFVLLQVVDLLIAMTRSACVSPRRDTIFSPYPTVVDPTKSTELALNPKVIGDGQYNVHAEQTFYPTIQPLNLTF